MKLRENDYFDHYQIRSHVAEGSTANVYRALDVQTGREVALKIPLRSVILDAARYEQFLRELEAMRILQHPAVQGGIESGQYESTPYLVTDWVEGKSLRRLIKSSSPFSVDRAIMLTRKIAEALAYCHEQGVVHRDVKPDNILIMNEDQPAILDFGLALTPTRPGPGKAAGTPGYVAPEQIEGQRGDKRIDVYALGATFYDMLAGEPPFIGQDPWDVMSKHLTEAVPRLDKVRPDVSLELATVVAKCLQRDPNQRYSDMNAFLNDLEHLNGVDTQALDTLTAAPPKPPFFKTQVGQVILLLTATIIGMALVTLVAVALKH